MLARVVGYILSPTRSLECHASYTLVGLNIAAHPARCKRLRLTQDQRTSAFNLLPNLHALNGRSLSCGVMDGGNVIIEGFDSQKSFSLFAGNPQLCTDSGSLLVTQLLKILQ